MQKPGIGRIVHHVETDGTHKPGIIHTVHGDNCVSLTVFTFGGPVSRTSVLLDAGSDGGEGKGVQHKTCTWHWPEQV